MILNASQIKINHSFRTRHLRKAEAAQLKKEALQTATKKKEEPVSSKTEAVAKEESSSEDSVGNVTSTESKADVSTRLSNSPVVCCIYTPQLFVSFC